MGPAVLLRRERRKWLGEEGSNPHYQGQNLASYH